MEDLEDLGGAGMGRRHSMGTSKVIQQPRQPGSWALSQGPGCDSQSCRAWRGGSWDGAVALRDGDILPRPALAGAYDSWKES